MKRDQSRVMIAVLAILGVIALLFIPFAKRVGLFSSPPARPSSQPSSLPTKSAQFKTRAASQQKRSSQLEPFQRPKREEGTPRIGEGGMIAMGLVHELGLSPDKVLIGEEAVWTLREQMKELVREHSVVEIDDSDHSMVIRIDSFREEADLFVQEFLVSLRTQLGEERFSPAEPTAQRTSISSTASKHTVNKLPSSAVGFGSDALFDHLGILASSHPVARITAMMSNNHNPHSIQSYLKQYVKRKLLKVSAPISRRVKVVSFRMLKNIINTLIQLNPEALSEMIRLISIFPLDFPSFSSNERMK